jgi:glycosyltransferase involved in cell wall biosynthesis
MLHDNGYPYELLALKNFNNQDFQRVGREGLHINTCLAQTHLHPYKSGEGPKPTTDKEVGFDDQVKIHLEGDPKKDAIGYKEALKPFHTIITHDLMFLEWFLPQNEAIRKCIELYPEKNWLHWIHSGPSVKPGDCVYPTTQRYSAAPNSTYVFLNDGQRLECALMLGTTRDKIAVVQNPKDVRDVYSFCHETRRLIDAYDLFNHDILQIYPFSTPRWESKGVKVLLKIFSEWKKSGIRAKLVLVNAHCNSKKDKPQVDAMFKYCEKIGLTIDDDVIFTSRFAELMARSTPDVEKQHYWSGWKISVPGNVVRDLGLMTNIFIFPSRTECCSLIQAEAAISGKFFVLNRDFRPMLEFASNKVLTYEFNTNDPDRNATYYECVAREVWSEMQTESAIMNATLARTKVYNRDWIFKNQFEPLIWKKFSAGKQDTDKAEKPSGKGLSTMTLPPRRIQVDTVPVVDDKELVDYRDPKPGTECPIYGKCSEEKKSECYSTAGHCLMLDEVPHG